ncbi:MAG: hypothetical protein E7469_02195 [Ruminococcaceae bacterium]|nr:hypothetical protein [Oscillospiraceae bacterium]
MRKKNEAKIVALCLVVLVLFVRLVVLLTVPIGSLGVEEREIKKDGETIYVRGDCPWASGGNTILFAGVVDAGQSSCRAYYMLGDTEREWLYVTGWRTRGFYQRVDHR